MRLCTWSRSAAIVVLALWLAALPAACTARPTPATSQPTPPATPSPAPTPASASGPAVVGQTAPDFAFPALEGQTTRLSDYRGKVVLVNLWATWCGPCRMEVPDLVAAYEHYKDRGLIVLAVNQGEPRDQVQTFASSYGMRFPVLLDLQGRIRSNYPYRGIPTTFIVDRQGIVRNIWVGTLPGEKLSQLVEPLLGT